MADKREKSVALANGSSPMDTLGSAGDDGEGSATMRTAETLLRLLPTALCVVALVIMLKNSQSNDFGSLSYSDLGAFRYLFTNILSTKFQSKNSTFYPFS